MKKFIATILIIGLVLSLNFNLFLSKPKQAQALVDVIGGPSNILKTIKDLALDTIGHTITQTVLTVLKQKIMDWGMGRKSDSMQPFQVTDWIQFFKDAAALGAAKYIAEFEQTKIEPGIKSIMRNLGFDTYAQDMLVYRDYARSTLEEDLGGNYQNFVDSNYSLQAGGWQGWFSLMRPQNNLFGQILMAEEARGTVLKSYISQEKEAADKQTDASGGFRNEEATTQTDVDKCKENCAAAGPPSPDCLQKCELLPGMAIETQIKNWGSDINKLMTKSLGADMDRLISTDEITELLGVLFSAITSKAINTGLAFGSSLLTSNQLDQARVKTKTVYSYQMAFKKEQTVEDIKDVRSQTLSNILKSIQQLSRSITKCEKSDDDKMVKYDDFVKNLDDIFSPSVEALYIGLEGLNLKPDFEVLDPRFAPYTVYGYSWSHVPASKFPDKCKAITDQLRLGDNATCRNIRSGLEPNFDSRCEDCMYDHDALSCPIGPIPPIPYPTEIPEETIRAKQDFKNACNDWYFQVQNRCGECLKRADEKCNQLDDQQREQCILNNCSNYGDSADHVVSPIIDGLDFHEKCLIEEKKDACYVCLKEYFMPATYCEQTQDYMARSLIKYPAVIKKVRNNAPDHEIWIGLYDETFGEMLGGDCDNNDEAELIDLAIICRIMPDFTYGGQKVCETQCSQAGLTGQTLRDALKDITDFRPNSKDCNRLKLPIGGKETWAPINDGVFHTRAKCCGALWQHDAEKYAICVGSGQTVETEPIEQGNETVCHTNCDPNIPGSCDTPDEGEVGWAAKSNMSLNQNMNRQAGFASMIHRGQAYENCVILRSLREPFRGATYYITKPYCDMVRIFQGDELYFYDTNGDGQFSDTAVDDPAYVGAFLGYCQDSNGNFKDAQGSDIVAEFDIDEAPLDSITGKPYEVVCGLSNYSPPEQYNLDNVNDRQAICNQLNITPVCGKREICDKLGISWEICQNKKWAWTGGLWQVIKAENGQGASELCVCETPEDGCGQRCAEAGCQ